MAKKYLYIWEEIKTYPRHIRINTFGLTVEGKKELIKFKRERY